jgi:hypothetical protein
MIEIRFNNKKTNPIIIRKGISMGYLICKSCGGRYDLQPGESPDDFESCQCRGELDYYDDQGLKQPILSREKKGMHPLLKTIIIIVGGILLFSYVFVPSIALLFMGMKYMGPTYFFTLFFGILIAIILVLVWYFRRRS